MVDATYVSQTAGFEPPSRALNDADADRIRSRMAQAFGMVWVGPDCAAEPYASYAVEGTQLALDAEIVRQTAVAAVEIENLLLVLEDVVLPEDPAHLVRTILATFGLHATDGDVRAAIDRVERRRAARPAPMVAAPVPVALPPEPAIAASSRRESIPSLIFKLISSRAVASHAS